MNTTWKRLLIIGTIILLLVIGWEVFQIASGGKTSFNLTVLEMGRSNIFSPNLERHLTTDPEYQKFVLSRPDFLR